ncbi:MAG: response regulator transcription factor, partial [Pseudomonadota bacterium]
QKQAVLKKTIARRSTALQREAEAHQNAIAVLEESQNCIRKITDSSEFDNREAGKDLAKILAQSEALIHQADATNSRPTRYKFGSWQLDIKNRVLLDDANPVSLSPTEFDLLSVMVRNSRQVLSRDQLLKQARGRVPGPHDRSVDVHVAKLRKILNRSDCDSPVILTVRNSGYMLARDVSIS